MQHNLHTTHPFPQYDIPSAAANMNPRRGCPSHSRPEALSEVRGEACFSRGCAYWFSILSVREEAVDEKTGKMEGACRSWREC